MAKDADAVGRGSRKKIAQAKAAGIGVARRPTVTIDNPFEHKVQRVKHEVLGRKVKGHAGKPAQAHSRAMQKVPPAPAVHCPGRAPRAAPCTGGQCAIADGSPHGRMCGSAGAGAAA